MKRHDLFISHSSGDVAIARELRQALEAAGYSCWMAPDDVTGTATWIEQILEAIEASRAMIVLVSGHANRSSHVSREVNLALGRQHPVLPIRVEPVGPQGNLEYLLSLVQRLDAFPPPVSAHMDPILRRVAMMLAGADGSTKPTGALEPGAVVADFTITEPIGQGGMSTVYRARQASPSRDVALKVIRADHAADAAYRARFLAEKETLGALAYQSIVPIYSAGEASGVLYIAMQLVDGQDLGARLAAMGPMSPEDTAALLQPIARAIDFAHARGVIHRDVKPSNILLDSSGNPYLSDFGLGWRVEGGHDATDPGVAIGTVEYMAPEQFTRDEEHAVSPAIDIYALGCVAYACLSGRPPFAGDTPQQTVEAHLHRPVPSLVAASATIPPAVDSVLRRALAKDPGDRYATASEMVDGLAVAARSVDTIPLPPPRLSMVARLRAWIEANTPAALGLAGVAAIVALVILYSVFIAPVPSPCCTPSPPSPTATPTAAPTPSPTPTPTVTVPPADVFPNGAERVLMANLPQLATASRNCERYDKPYAGATASISCDDPLGGTHNLYYFAFAAKSAMDDAYEFIVNDAGVEPGGRCVDGIPANAPWTFGADAGQLACYASPSDATRVIYTWTDDKLLVLSYWGAPTNDDGYTFWVTWVKAIP